MSDHQPPGGAKPGGGGGKPPSGGGPKGPPKGPPAAPASAGVPVAEIGIAAIALLVLLPSFGAFYFASGGLGIAVFFLKVYTFLKTAATIICMIALVIIVYATIRIHEIAAEENKKLGLELSWDSERKQKNVRWERVEQYMTSLNPSDWKIAILEADNILDDIIERIGYKGATLGERLKNIEASDFPYLEEAWQAHKLRNALAHKGTNYELTKGEAEQTINIYHRIFKSLGYL